MRLSLSGGSLWRTIGVTWEALRLAPQPWLWCLPGGCLHSTSTWRLPFLYKYIDSACFLSVPEGSLCSINTGRLPVFCQCQCQCQCQCSRSPLRLPMLFEVPGGCLCSFKCLEAAYVLFVLGDCLCSIGNWRLPVFYTYLEAACIL